MQFGIVRVLNMAKQCSRCALMRFEERASRHVFHAKPEVVCTCLKVRGREIFCILLIYQMPFLVSNDHFLCLIKTIDHEILKLFSTVYMKRLKFI